MLPFSFTVYSQKEILTPQTAVALALDNNYDIVLARNESEISRINNNKGAAGMLPIINIKTGEVFNVNNIHQELNSGIVTNKNWVPVNNINASVNLSYTLFDGMKMFATKERLEALQTMGAIQLDNQIQNTFAQVLSAYYKIVQQQQQIKAYQETMKISEERVLLSQKKWDVGYSDKTPLLQAKVDLSNQKINIINLQNIVQQSKIALNQLMNVALDYDYEVIDTIEISYNPILENRIDTAMLVNYALKLSEKNLDIAKLQYKDIKSQKMPYIGLSSGYSFSQNNSRAGLLLVNRSYGPSIGINATIPIYNGGTIKKQLEASTVNIANQYVFMDKIKMDLSTKITMAYNNYVNAKNIWLLNEENVSISKENVTITMEKFRLNQSTSLDIKTAQSSYENALYDVINARYAAKLAEIELRLLSNDFSK